VAYRLTSTQFCNVNRDKKEIERLEEYIGLVENYEDNTLEKWIVKEYAYTNSLVEVVIKCK
jgi:hypothetical protein